MMETKELAIFNHIGNKIKTDDRDVQILAKFHEPFVAVLGNVLSDEECDELISLSIDRMNRSKIAGNQENDIRTSTSVFLPEDASEVVQRVEKRISQIMNIPVEHGEGLQLLNYQIGQEYKAHFDFFSPKKLIENPRISTLVLYLNDVEEGGDTYFPNLKLSVSPHKGMAVYFEYFYDDPMLNELTLHGGAPVTIGDKWAATMWMRRKAIR
ncbi:2OG-Fe(II) oxygenase [Bacillus coahuilensis p1.1.43]|uniref:2OG-Fe(II) oxygenase n=1 Tax=Bacillus coahuilensis p1.1.43 TaxID=1150625 RepID=A0A147KBR3_9BACI|nr:2OG-Fe(II) oxygenase [Bacillus coahuilensis]KUP08873.1 2OG-Fe(II) oxygenase [Bacillus coahuilensis p1.1.43]